MVRCIGSRLWLVFGVMIWLIAGTIARADDIEAFYRSHTLTLGSPNSPGGGYDVYLRALARHLAKYIPGNPNIIVQNVPAAGGMVLANQLYNTAPKDGSYFGMVRGTAIQEEVYKSPRSNSAAAVSPGSAT
jgi:tripartite-type tricarboxylate transporter receptor subunit TctC